MIRSPALLALVLLAILAACATSTAPARENTLAKTPSPKAPTQEAAPPPAIAEEASEAVATNEVATPKSDDAEKTKEGPSCTGASGAGKDCNGESCCTRILVPEGDFEMKRDTALASEKVHVRAFYLDKYEITVGRIRAWLEAGRPMPKEGELLYKNGDELEVRWPKDAAVQDEKSLVGWKRYDTWTAGDGRLPKNFLNWYTAAAFCHAEGGRLPTEAEWKYTAVGGDEQRPYPWGSEAPTQEHAVYNCIGDGDQSCALSDILPVGSRPKGVGRWGHMDLAGSMFEWTMDGAPSTGGGESQAISRGGGFCYIGGVDRRAKTGLKPLVYRKDNASTVSQMVGARCAFDAK